MSLTADQEVKLALLVSNAIRQVEQEYEAYGWMECLQRAKAQEQRERELELPQDPIKVLDKGHFAPLWSLDLNLLYWLDEQKADGQGDVLHNRDFRKWLVKQPEVPNLKRFPLFTEDWDRIRKAGEGDKKE
jgi:hypothetical protein